jgi:hypothetical protein
MNKELIKKYKIEFEYWLNDSELLCLLDNPDENWFKVSKDTKIWAYDYDKDIKFIVINDEYVEFRKALAEGKTIQVFNKHTEKWIDLDKILENTNISLYRIKPEEPQFKVGDFVCTKCKKHIYKIESITENGTLFNTNLGAECINDRKSFYTSELEKWEPQADELCWFSEEKQESSAKLGHFTKINSVGKYVDSSNIAWKYCEPFLNTKPSWFKN